MGVSGGCSQVTGGSDLIVAATSDHRSGERRVGEEGRTRWAADYLKKKKHTRRRGPRIDKHRRSARERLQPRAVSCAYSAPRTATSLSSLVVGVREIAHYPRRRMRSVV